MLLGALDPPEKQGQATPQPVKTADGLSSELEKLASLRASGVLTEEESQQAKKRVLGQQPMFLHNFREPLLAGL
jgi:Short C-terminal domain